jgi:hypothetical protein
VIIRSGYVPVNPIAADHMEEVTHPNHVALFRTQGEKAVDGALDMPHGYGFG